MLPPHSIITLIALALPAALGLPSQSHPETNVLPRQQARHDPIDPTSVLNKNRVGKTLNAYTPDCYEDNDPSYAQGKSKYTDNQGVWQYRQCNKGPCWTDVYYVEYQAYYEDWQPTGQVIDCKTTESCDEVSITMNQSCVTNTNTWDNSVNLGISPTWEVLKDELSIGGNLAYQHNWGGQQSDQYCQSFSNSGTCTWNDQGCHAIWNADRNIRVFGYMRRRCKSSAQGVNMPDTTGDENGDYTRGMLDFDFVLPQNSIVGCAAKCGDATYPNPRPGSDPLLAVPTTFRQ